MSNDRSIKKKEERIREMIILYEDEDTPARRAWKKMLEYFALNDRLEATNHIELIEYIYNPRRYVRQTLFCVAWNNYIGERTLYRYRKKYIKCFDLCYRNELGLEKI